MRLIALLQIALLLTTSILPEGRILMSQSRMCDGGECGCSAEARNGGTCCCTIKTQGDRESDDRCEQNSDGDATVAESTGRCCSLTTRQDDSARDSCSTKAAPIAGCGQPTDALVGTVSSCACGEDSPGVWVSHMPQTMPILVTAPEITFTGSLKAPVDDQRHRKVDKPPTPPPNAIFC